MNCFLIRAFILDTGFKFGNVELKAPNISFCIWWGYNNF